MLFSPTVRRELVETLTPAREDRRRPRSTTGSTRSISPTSPSAHPRSLSGGQRQRVAIAAVAVGGAPVLLLDEPTRGMDAPSRTALERRGARTRGRRRRGRARHPRRRAVRAHRHPCRRARRRRDRGRRRRPRRCWPARCSRRRCCACCRRSSPSRKSTRSWRAREPRRDHAAHRHGRPVRPFAVYLLMVLRRRGGVPLPVLVARRRRCRARPTTATRRSSPRWSARWSSRR